MKRKFSIYSAALILFFSVSALSYSQTGSSNPFFRGTENSTVSKSVPAANSTFLEAVTEVQKKINSRISAVINDYKTDKNINLLFYIACFAFIYGFIHAMTPGHGKNIILGWILTSERTFIKVLLTSVAGMFLHVFNSVLMVYIIWFIIRGKMSIQSPLFIRYFSFAACLILFIMSFKSIYDLFRDHHRKNDPSGEGKEDTHIKGHSRSLEKIDRNTSIRECLLISLGIGMVPCPVAAILTVFMISASLYAESLFAALFFTAGMTLTLSIHSTAVWLLRSFITGIKNRHLKKARDIVLPALGSILLMFSGFLLITPYINL